MREIIGSFKPWTADTSFRLAFRVATHLRLVELKFVRKFFTVWPPINASRHKYIRALRLARRLANLLGHPLQAPAQVLVFASPGQSRGVIHEVQEGMQWMLVKFLAREAAWLKFTAVNAERFSDPATQWCASQKWTTVCVIWHSGWHHNMKTWGKMVQVFFFFFFTLW